MRHFAIVVMTLAALAAAPAFAGVPDSPQDHHAHAGQPSLHLNAGRKWQTDPPLRLAMGEMSRTMTSVSNAVHEGRLPERDYRELAGTIERHVTTIVAQCKLPQDADAQLHIIIANLLVGASQMAGKDAAHAPRDGALKVIDALDDYGTYFDDAGFQSPAR